MHDMVHDFAQNLTKNESFSVEIDGAAESKIDSFSRDARHFKVVFKNYETDSFPATIYSLKKLRSLIVDGRPSLMNAALPKLIANLSCLRTLKLSGCGIVEVPSNIGKLIHLRHVDLSQNEFRELPKEMCELYNMLTLDVSLCEKLEKLPDNIGKLVKLRYLSVRVYWSDSSFVKIRGVKGLSSLRGLDEFHAPNNTRKYSLHSNPSEEEFCNNQVYNSVSLSLGKSVRQFSQLYLFRCYCHPQCFIYRRKQTLEKNKTLKKRTDYVLIYQRSCITS
ncbi:hypothetical protein Peur_034940 [Populus x canadensis]